MDVGSGYPKGLGSGAAILLGQVVVTNAYINGISGTYNTEKKNNNRVSFLIDFKGLLSFSQVSKLMGTEKLSNKWI